MHNAKDISEQIRKILERNMEGIESFVFFLAGDKFGRKAIMGTKAGPPRDIFYLTGFMISCLLTEVPVNFHEKVLKDMIKGHHDAFINGRGQLLPGWEIKPTKKEEIEDESNGFYHEPMDL